MRSGDVTAGANNNFLKGGVEESLATSFVIESAGQ